MHPGLGGLGPLGAHRTRAEACECCSARAGPGSLAACSSQTGLMPSSLQSRSPLPGGLRQLVPQNRAAMRNALGHSWTWCTAYSQRVPWLCPHCRLCCQLPWPCCTSSPLGLTWAPACSLATHVFLQLTALPATLEGPGWQEGLRQRHLGAWPGCIPHTGRGQSCRNRECSNAGLLGPLGGRPEDLHSCHLTTKRECPVCRDPPAQPPRLRPWASPPSPGWLSNADAPQLGLLGPQAGNTPVQDAAAHQPRTPGGRSPARPLPASRGRHPALQRPRRSSGPQSKVHSHQALGSVAPS